MRTRATEQPFEPFRCIEADPPWQFRDRLPGKSRGAERHYPTLATQQIIDLPIKCGIFDGPAGKLMGSGIVAEDAYLLLWRVASMQQAALDVAKGWGFTVKTEIVWVKQTAKGLRHFGMGHHLRAAHEVCLVCTRGKPKPLNRSTRTVLEGVVAEHSRKPDAFKELVERTFPGPYLEIFGRRHRPGWTVIGDQLPDPPPEA